MEAPPPAGFFATAPREVVEDYLGWQYATEAKAATRQRKPSGSIQQQIAAAAARAKELNRG